MQDTFLEIVTPKDYTNQTQLICIKTTTNLYIYVSTDDRGICVDILDVKNQLKSGCSVSHPKNQEAPA